jgi:S1-C subfamily serine protease
MEPSTNRNLIIAVAVAAAAVIFSLCACLVIGGITAAIIARQAASPARILEVAPVVPELPALPELPELPQAPELPELAPAETPQAPALPELPPGIGAGAYIREVIAGSPADEAGVRVGDIVLQVDDVSLTGVGAKRLAEVIATYRPGDTLMLGVIRGEIPRAIEVTLGENPDNPELPYLGVRYADLVNGQAPAPAD